MTESVQDLKHTKSTKKIIFHKNKRIAKKDVILLTEQHRHRDKIMQNTIIFVLLFVLTLIIATTTLYIYKINTKITNINKTLEHQYNLIVKMQSVLKNKYATNAIAENAEMIYQDLLQSLIPIMAAIDIMPRNTQEHPLWRALGGIMDEYAKNPFALEKLRRGIKLDSEVARNIDNYMRRADNFLHHLTTTEPDGLLSNTFTDGLLGQSLTFFAQAKQLATQSN